MKLIDLQKGIEILRKYSPDFQMETINKSFPNGAPAPTFDCYISIEVFSLISEEESLELIKHNWKYQQDGEVWLFGNFYSHDTIK